MVPRTHRRRTRTHPLCEMLQISLLTLHSALFGFVCVCVCVCVCVSILFNVSKRNLLLAANKFGHLRLSLSAKNTSLHSELSARRYRTGNPSAWEWADNSPHPELRDLTPPLWGSW